MKHAHVRTHARTHARTHTRTHARTHTQTNARAHSHTHTHKVMPCTPATRKLLERRLATLVSSAPSARQQVKSPESDDRGSSKPRRAPPATSPRMPRSRTRPSTSASASASSRAPSNAVQVIDLDADGLFSDEETDYVKKVCSSQLFVICRHY